MSEKIPLPLYYEGQALADMEASLRKGYLTSSGWLESAEAKLAVRKGKPVPWFTYAAIDFLEKEVTSGCSVFEYGGGQSTLYWADRVRKVCGIDHDPAFVDHVSSSLPSNAEFQLVPEGAPVPVHLERWLTTAPKFQDPSRDVRTYRSGQLNAAFAAYALRLFEYSRDAFDVVVIDGMARVFSTWAAIQHFDRGGFIVFDNSDREFYRPAYEMLEDTGYRRIDFHGLGPINPYEWCTSVFYRPTRFQGTRWFEAAEPSTRGTVTPVARAGTGILVLGYNRPLHLQSVLESLRLQGHIEDVHVWLDGTQGRGEYRGQNEQSAAIARRYAVKELRVQRSHLGIEKMMLDALAVMSDQYDRVVVLEDDCFPMDDGILLFEEALKEIDGHENIYSVYGHHFGTEPYGERDFSRFQGWGWAAHSEQIKKYLPRLRELFLMDEQVYLKYVQDRLSPEVKARLDVTPGRDVIKVLSSFFSWDSATAFLTACDGVMHKRTLRPAVTNTGIVKGIGHFHEDSERLRKPPFNMVPLDEAWSHFDTRTRACMFDKPSYGLDELDLRILESVPLESGFFVELGAYDGITQSNSVLFEKRGWKGLLIEANPGMYAKCRKARPHARSVHAACVSSEYAGSTTTITDVGLMSMTSQTRLSKEQKADWIKRGEGFAKRPKQEIDVPVRTLSGILDNEGIEHFDLLLLDVEGAEIEVLKGLDFSRHAPKWIVAEDAYDNHIEEFLGLHGYGLTKVLLERKFTRDCLYTFNN